MKNGMLDLVSGLVSHLFATFVTSLDMGCAEANYCLCVLFPSPQAGGCFGKRGRKLGSFSGDRVRVIEGGRWPGDRDRLGGQDGPSTPIFTGEKGL